MKSKKTEKDHFREWYGCQISAAEVTLAIELAQIENRNEVSRHVGKEYISGRNISMTMQKLSERNKERRD